ncbi:hypothetical protein OO014_08785 [Intrasporangium calvum]|uniref:Uncharacterized protein n=1 Tax=Intrasporangium calvum TaxID=53358 RepID=A0ABT5GGG9_9MICO|nr:hypothetical protein [Intrasporangium calvum]MDC5697349.1 hypothetical protein [Intrasporangium calvum]
MPTPQAVRRRLPRPERAVVARAVADLHDGVAHRADLRAVGVTRADVRTEVGAGRWVTAGRHTVAVRPGPLGTEARHWQAVWETGSGACSTAPRPCSPRD